MTTIRNNVQLVGNLGADPEIKTLDGDKKVANFSLAVTESYKDKDGNKVQTTNWFKCSAWNGLATLMEKYATKGKRIAVSGRLVNREWIAEGGAKVTQTEILVSDILLLGGGNRKDNNA